MSKNSKSIRALGGKMALFVCAGLLAAGLAGCREDEQNRALHLEKGTYAGKADKELTPEQQRALQARGNRQKF